MLQTSHFWNLVLLTGPFHGTIHRPLYLKLDKASMSSSDPEDNDELPETYIEEIVTERQFIDSDGNVQTEVTTVEQVKTKKKKKINSPVTKL